MAHPHNMSGGLVQQTLETEVQQRTMFISYMYIKWDLIFQYKLLNLIVQNVYALNSQRKSQPEKLALLT